MREPSRGSVPAAARIDRVALHDAVRELSTLRPWRSATAIATEWAVIAGTIALAVRLHEPAWYVLAVLIVASRQHALGVLVHEATHYRLFASRRVNDLVADVFCAFPIGIGTSAYRVYHFKHHQSVNTADDPDWHPLRDDPDWNWPKTAAKCALLFLRDVAGLNMRMLLSLMKRWSPFAAALTVSPAGPVSTRAEILRVVLWYSSLAWVLVWTPGAATIYVGLWLLPQLTVLTAIFRIRALAEHYCVAGDDELTNTRTVRPHLIERLIIAPCHVNHHLEHHLFPSVPFYNLPQLHALLRARGDLDEACVTDGYVLGREALIRQLCRRPSVTASPDDGQDRRHGSPD